MEKIKKVFSNMKKWIKSHLKVILAVIVIIIVAIIALNLFGGSEKNAIKKYLSAVNSCDDSKIIKAMDTKGAIAWDNSGYSDEDIIKNFQDELKDIEDDEIDDYKKEIKDTYDKDNKGKVKCKLKSVVYSSKAKDNKDLTKVVCKVELTRKPTENEKDDLEDSVWKNEKTYTTKAESYMTFYLYKNKVIDSPMDSMYSLLNQ